MNGPCPTVGPRGAALAACGSAILLLQGPALGEVDADPDVASVLEAESVRGSLSDFWGLATRLSENRWRIEHEDHVAIAEVEGAVVILRYEDGRAPAVALVTLGTPANLLEMLACSFCSIDACCDTYCTTTNSWCRCTARVTCTHGVRSISMNGSQCSFECFPPPPSQPAPQPAPHSAPQPVPPLAPQPSPRPAPPPAPPATPTPMSPSSAPTPPPHRP